MKISMILLLITTGSLAIATSPKETMAKERSKNALFGSWLMKEIHYIYSDTTVILDMKYPGRLIISDSTYSIMYNPYGQQRKAAANISKLSDHEMIYAFKTLAFNTGSYVMTDSLFITTANIAKVAGFEGGKQYYKYQKNSNLLDLVMFDETYPDGKKPEWYGKLKILFKLERE